VFPVLPRKGGRLSGLEGTRCGRETFDSAGGYSTGRREVKVSWRIVWRTRMTFFPRFKPI
jgi:hypothetical protein